MMDQKSAPPDWSTSTCIQEPWPGRERASALPPSPVYLPRSVHYFWLDALAYRTSAVISPISVALRLPFTLTIAGRIGDEEMEGRRTRSADGESGEDGDPGAFGGLHPGVRQLGALEALCPAQSMWYSHE